MKISVVIPTFNRSDVLCGLTLPSLARQKIRGRELEVIVVDDGSTDDTVSRILQSAEANTFCRVLRQPNAGPAAARNAGLGLVSGDVVVIIGDDTFPPHENFLELHAQFHEQHPSAPPAAMLGLTLWDPSIETPFMEWLQRHDKQFAYGSIQDQTFVDGSRYLYTSNISFSTQFLRDCGLLMDERFTAAAYEDAEWGYRLKVHCGLSIFYDARALLYHHHPYTSQQFARRSALNARWLKRAKTINPAFYDLHLSPSSLSVRTRMVHGLLKGLCADRFVNWVDLSRGIEHLPRWTWPLALHMLVRRSRSEG